VANQRHIREGVGRCPQMRGCEGHPVAIVVQSFGLMSHSHYMLYCWAAAATAVQYYPTMYERSLPYLRYMT
jgi:hypothetical protein